MRFVIGLIHINSRAHARYPGSNDENRCIGVGFPASHVVPLWIVFWAGSRKLFRHLGSHVGIEDSVRNTHGAGCLYSAAKVIPSFPGKLMLAIFLQSSTRGLCLLGSTNRRHDSSWK